MFLILMGWVLSYIYLDYMLLGINQRFFILLLERLAFAALTLTSVRHLKKSKDKFRFDLNVLVWSLALVIVSFSASIMHPPLQTDRFAYHYVLVLGFYLIVPNRIIFKIIPALTISLLDITLLILLSLTGVKATVDSAFVSIITFLAINVIGLMVAARLERQRFHQYLIQKTLSSGREQLIALATTDSLTGILNRRGFFDLAEIEVDRFLRYQTIFSFAIIDLDQLKAINDQHGHPTGDLALQTLIDCIEQERRSSDFLGRLAGDEFGLCMPGIHKNEAQTLMTRIHKKLSQKTVILKSGEALQVYFSAGITEVFPDDETFDDLYRRADKALYKAKHKGRNLVEIA